MVKQNAIAPECGHAELVSAAERIAEQIALSRCEAGEDNDRAPHAELRLLAQEGILTAPLPEALGGLGWGTEPGGQLPLLRTLAAVGGADLALGRLFEGHVNGLILINAFGTRQQLLRAAEDAHAGLLFGVWNTGDGDAMHLKQAGECFALQGSKGFATGAAFVRRPIVTAEREGWQMTLPRMESLGVAKPLQVDRSSWYPLGMQRSESFTVDFTGAELRADDLIGAPGDFYRDPLFRGGAVRFAAVQAGAVVRLALMFANWLRARGRENDPYQLRRTGEIALAAQEAVLWIERAAAVAEKGLYANSNAADTRRMVDCANMTRVAIERLATSTMPKIIEGVGAHGLLRPHGFERILRDLTMYLRQPNPDGTLAEVGRSALQSRDPLPGTASDGDWQARSTHRSLWSEPKPVERTTRLVGE